MKFEFIDSRNIKFVFEIVGNDLMILANAIDGSFFFTAKEPLKDLTARELWWLPSQEALQFWMRIWNNKAFL
jgi:hypothetical protein